MSVADVNKTLANMAIWREIDVGSIGGRRGLEPRPPDQESSALALTIPRPTGGGGASSPHELRQTRRPAWRPRYDPRQCLPTVRSP